jgi:hypothetical protein
MCAPEPVQGIIAVVVILVFVVVGIVVGGVVAYRRVQRNMVNLLEDYRRMDEMTSDAVGAQEHEGLTQVKL